MLTTNDGFLTGSVDIQLEEAHTYAARIALLLDEDHKTLVDDGDGQEDVRAVIPHHSIYFSLNYFANKWKWK